MYKLVITQKRVNMMFYNILFQIWRVSGLGAETRQVLNEMF